MLLHLILIDIISTILADVFINSIVRESSFLQAFFWVFVHYRFPRSVASRSQRFQRSELIIQRKSLVATIFVYVIQMTGYFLILTFLASLIIIFNLYRSYLKKFLLA